MTRLSYRRDFIIHLSASIRSSSSMRDCTPAKGVPSGVSTEWRFCTELFLLTLPTLTMQSKSRGGDLASNTAAVALSADRIKTLIAREEDAFRVGRRRSDEEWREARQVEPRGVPSSHQDAAPQPIFIERGQGRRVWEVDGNEYVDFHNGFGVMVVGHAHPLIVKTVSEQIARGSHFAQPGHDVAVVARNLARRFGQPQWRFSN